MLNNFHRFQIFRQLSNLLSQLWLKKRHTSLFSGNCREIRKNFHWKFAEKMQILTRKWKKLKFNIQSRKNIGDFWLKFWDWRTVQMSALCRSRRELSNEYSLAKIGVDTAENEPLEVWGKIQFTIHFTPYALLLPGGGPAPSRVRKLEEGAAAPGCAGHERRMSDHQDRWHMHIYHALLGPS